MVAVARGRDPASVSRLEVLDTAKRSLDDDIAKAVKNQDREEAMRLQSMQTALLNELDTLTGGQYAAARDLGGEAPRIISAFEQGSKAMRPSVSRRTVTEQANALRPQDRPAYAAGRSGSSSQTIGSPDASFADHLPDPTGFAPCFSSQRTASASLSK